MVRDTERFWACWLAFGRAIYPRSTHHRLLSLPVAALVLARRAARGTSSRSLRSLLLTAFRLRSHRERSLDCWAQTAPASRRQLGSSLHGCARRAARRGLGSTMY